MGIRKRKCCSSEAHDLVDAGAAVPGPVEQDDFAALPIFPAADRA
jgi:hypothetical protein